MSRTAPASHRLRGAGPGLGSTDLSRARSFHCFLGCARLSLTICCADVASCLSMAMRLVSARGPVLARDLPTVSAVRRCVSSCSVSLLLPLASSRQVVAGLDLRSCRDRASTGRCSAPRLLRDMAARPDSSPQSSHNSVGRIQCAVVSRSISLTWTGTAIPPWKRRIPFDLRSKARSGPVSTEVGDDSGILRCRSFLLGAPVRFGVDGRCAACLGAASALHGRCGPSLLPP